MISGGTLSGDLSPKTNTFSEKNTPKIHRVSYFAASLLNKEKFSKSPVCVQNYDKRCVILLIFGTLTKSFALGARISNLRGPLS